MTDAPKYGDAAYWDARYTTENDDFEWYQEFKAIRDIVSREFKDPAGAVLHLGCGTSSECWFGRRAVVCELDMVGAVFEPGLGLFLA